MIVGHIGGGAVGGYQIEKSLRFRAAASAYLSRTPSVAGNRKTWTWSGWVKRGALGTRQFITMSGVNPNPSQVWQVEFNANNKLEFYNNTINTYRLSTRVFRDPSAWLHIVFCADTDNGTVQNRFRCWVNGEEITAWDTNLTITSGYSFAYNGAYQHGIGAYTYSPSNYLDGYLSEINFIDGQALTPDSFGEFNADGVWVPKKYTGTYGTNGFYLPFNDGTNLTELCRDRSGNGNDWTANNIGLTAGATYDWMDDTPTNNFAVLNPLVNTAGRISYGFANLHAQEQAGTDKVAHCGVAIPSYGKWYFEYLVSAVGLATQIGVSDNTTAQSSGTGFAGGAFRMYRGDTGQKTTVSANTAYGSTFTTNDLIGVAVDMDAGTITFYKNNASQGVAFSDLSGGAWFPAVYINSANGHFNFGQRPFAYDPPAGFKALSTKNRPSVTITDPSQHHTVITTTKSGDTNFTLPWNATEYDTLFWIKSRSPAGDWYQIDGLRGYDKVLKSNSTAAETTDANVIGVSGTTCTLKSTLPNGTYVIYAWKAGRVADRQTNTDGSIASTVSANVTAGFSIVTYTGTGANATVGHGLGNVPKMVEVKRRNSTGDWLVWNLHVALTGADRVLFLNTTDSQTAVGTNFNSSSPTSSVVNLGTNAATNASGGTHVAYCHAEIPGYSKFGSYTGNGSTDGPFVWGDVSVMDVLWKQTNAAGQGWFIYDAIRDPHNVMSKNLYPNTNLGEENNAAIDALSNGHKLRTTNVFANGAGSTYIYAAYARHPFGAENVSPAPAR